jgi:tRNA A37 threonylcarbamoyladenosine dehydratase
VAVTMVAAPKPAAQSMRFGIQDPLAAKLRERLKSDFGVVKNSKGKLGIDCVF